jgi:hypothetical protein
MPQQQQPSILALAGMFAALVAIVVVIRFPAPASLPTPSPTPVPCTSVALDATTTPTERRDSFWEWLTAQAQPACVAVGAQGRPPADLGEWLRSDRPGTIEGGPNITQLLQLNSYVESCNENLNAAQYASLMGGEPGDDEYPWGIGVWAKRDGIASAAAFCSKIAAAVGSP